MGPDVTLDQLVLAGWDVTFRSWDGPATPDDRKVVAHARDQHGRNALGIQSMAVDALAEVVAIIKREGWL